MSNQVIIVNKPIGKTPFEMVEIFKEENPQYKDSTVSYAGRLDPMAHGLLILLIAEENKNRQTYLHLDKTYEVEILFGIETDTYDILGKITNVSLLPHVEKAKIDQALQSFIGKQEQVYPPYSSKAVLGKPLFWWARHNKLEEIEIPKKFIEIYSIKVLLEKKVLGKDLLKNIQERIENVHGNFRQEIILQKWENCIDKNRAYPVIKISVRCSSGTYMRTLAHEIGKKLGCGAIAYDIYRMVVGKYTLNSHLDPESSFQTEFSSRGSG